MCKELQEIRKDMLAPRLVHGKLITGKSSSHENIALVNSRLHGNLLMLTTQNQSINFIFRS